MLVHSRQRYAESTTCRDTALWKNAAINAY